MLRILRAGSVRCASHYTLPLSSALGLMNKHAFLCWLRFTAINAVLFPAAIVAVTAIFYWGEINWRSLAVYSLVLIGIGGALGNLAFRAELGVPAFSRLGAASWFLTLTWCTAWNFAAFTLDSSHKMAHTFSSQITFSLGLSFWISLMTLFPLRWLVSGRSDQHRQP
jgi:hypothetical protein